jgi:hypothetical protein
MGLADTEAYKRYLNEGKRLPDENFPPLEENSVRHCSFIPHEPRN